MLRRFFLHLLFNCFLAISLIMMVCLHEARGDSSIITKIVDHGEPATHIDLTFVGSGFAADEINTYVTSVDQNIEKMFLVNWFIENKELFNVWRIDAISPQSGVDLDEATIYSIGSQTPYDILIVIHNYEGQESVAKPYIELYKFSHNYVVLAHELGHVIGRLDDEYWTPATVWKCDGLSKRTLNIHDKPNNEKWPGLIPTLPYEGARFCETGLWRPSENSIMKDSANCSYFDAVGLKAMDLGAGKILGVIESNPPSLQVSGVSDGDTISGILNVEAITSDVSGIERVEFYWAKAGDTSKSIKIDRNPPYDIGINTSQYEDGQYFLDTLSYDKNWNYTRVTRSFNISHVLSLNIPIYVHEALIKNRAGVNRIDEPVTVGVPLPEDSGITSTSQLGLNGVNLQQFRTLAYWPNGNIKWVLIDTQVSVSAGEEATFYLTKGTGNSGGSNLAVDFGSYLLIDTEVAKFRIKGTAFNFFDEVIVGANKLVTQGNNGGLRLYNENGILFSSLYDSSSQAIIEENGPARAVVKVTGSCKNTASEELMWYTVRMHFYRGKSYVKAFVTLRNAMLNSISGKEFKSMDILVPLHLNGTDSFTFTTNKGVFNGNFTNSTDNAYLFQSFSNDHEFEGPRDDVYNFEECKTSMKLAFTEPGLLVGYNDNILNQLGNEQEWTEGWAEMHDSTGKGMTVSMKWMSAYWPAGFGFYGNGHVSVEFFSKHARYDSVSPLIFAFNAHETRELLFHFHNAHIDNELLVKNRLEAPLIARAPFDHYRKTKCLYGQDKLVTVDEENQWRQLHRLTPVTICDKTRGVNVWRHYWYSGVKAYDYPYKEFIGYLRDGCSNLFLNAEQKTQFNADYGVKHTDDCLFTELIAKDRYYWTKSSGTFQIGQFDFSHNHWLAMPLYYYHTGDERIREAILDYEEVYINGGPQDYDAVGDMRGLGRTIRTLAYLYDVTRDETTGEILKESMNSLLDSRDTEGSWEPGGRSLTRGYLWQCHKISHEPDRQIANFFITQILSDNCWSAYWILKNYAALNYKRIEDVEDFLSGLAQFITGELLFDDGEHLGYLYDYWLDAPNYIGDPHHPDDGAWQNTYGLRDTSRLMAYAYEQTGDTRYLSIGERILEGGPNFDHDMQRFHLMYDRLYQPGSSWQCLNDIQVQNDGPNQYTLTWTVPEDVVKYKIKFSDKPIVEWLGFNQLTRKYTYNPDEYTAFFAAINIDDEPLPAQQGSIQSYSLDISQVIESYNTTRNLTPDQPSFILYNPNKVYYFSMKYLTTNIPPSVSIIATPKAGYPPLTVNFNSFGNDGNSTIVAYKWDFGDGSFSTEQNPTHIYSRTGTYNVTLTATDNKGATGMTSILIDTIYPSPPMKLKILKVD